MYTKDTCPECLGRGAISEWCVSHDGNGSTGWRKIGEHKCQNCNGGKKSVVRIQYWIRSDPDEEIQIQKLLLTEERALATFPARRT